MGPTGLTQSLWARYIHRLRLLMPAIFERPLSRLRHVSAKKKVTGNTNANETNCQSSLAAMLPLSK